MIYRTLLVLLLSTTALFVDQAGATSATPFELKSFDARYKVSLNGIDLGTLELEFKLNEKGGYVYTGRTNSSSFVRMFYSDMADETSTGEYRKGQLIPTSYDYQLKKRDTLKEQVTLEFDWPKKTLWTTNEGTRWNQTTLPNTQDKLSLQQALRIDLAKGVKEVSYPVADGGKIKTFNFKVTDSENITTPHGKHDCLIVRRSKEDQAPDFTIWVAPELDYMPVRIDRKRSFGALRMELKSLKML